MKNSLLLSLLITVMAIGSACIKDNPNGTCTDKLPSSEAAAMQAYATANGITAQVHSSGLYYEIINQGTGPTPSATSKIYVKYTAKYVSNNNIFDQQTNSSATGWFLNSLIAGWQIGVPLIKEGGTIKLIVPSSLAYGCRGYNVIPGDAVLYFEIELVDVQ